MPLRCEDKQRGRLRTILHHAACLRLLSFGFRRERQAKAKHGGRPTRAVTNRAEGDVVFLHAGTVKIHLARHLRALISAVRERMCTKHRNNFAAHSFCLSDS